MKTSTRTDHSLPLLQLELDLIANQDDIPSVLRRHAPYPLSLLTNEQWTDEEEDFVLVPDRDEDLLIKRDWLLNVIPEKSNLTLDMLKTFLKSQSDLEAHIFLAHSPSVKRFLRRLDSRIRTHDLRQTEA